MSDPNACITDRNRRNSLIFNQPGTRYEPINPYSLGYTKFQLDMRRKAEILQYNKTSNQKATRKQNFVRAVNGSTQRKNYSSYYLKALQEGSLTQDELCPNDISIPTLTTASDVPGPSMLLFYDSTVPLYNYNSQQNANGTQNVDKKFMWLTNYKQNIVNNNPDVFTLNIQPAIDSTVYNYSFTTSVSLFISGFNTSHPGQDASGIFTMNIPPTNLTLEITYGGQTVSLNQTPTMTFSPGFLSNVSGYVLTRVVANSFSGEIYMGNITFSNIILSTYAGNTYDFNLRYIPNYSNPDGNIDDFSVTLKTNVSSDTAKKTESGLRFLTTPSTNTITTFSLNGVSS